MKLLLAIILGVLLIGLVPLARAAITNSSRVIPYQGRLTDSSGNNVADGTYSMTFKIYTVSTGGSASFTETNSSVSVSSGLFSVLLGSLSANGVNLDFANPPYYLGITVGANAEMSPRIQLGFAPLAHNSQYLDGTPLSSFQLNTGVLTGAAGTNTRLQATGTGTGSTGNGSIYFLDSSGNTRGRFDTVPFSATGGTITYSGGYTIHTFSSSGTFTPNISGTVDYLVVGGGGAGGGGAQGGGGGAGGFRTGSGLSVSAQAYNITVGEGGVGDTDDGANGSDSTFSTITSIGGGGGGVASAGASGGSGGGGRGESGTAGGAGTGGQGNNGGSGNVSPRTSGGGGGSSAVGSNGGSNGGNGGAGTASSISGSSVTYAGGGGGGVESVNSTASGGAGGGGNAGFQSAGVSGTANTGGGGGGASRGSSSGGGPWNGGNGGSGIVIIRYPTVNYGTFYLGATNTSSADLAEYYVTGDKSLEAGDVVTISNPNDQIPNPKGVLLKSNKPYDSKLVGIISTNPGVVLGSIDGDTGKSDKRQLALAGRVPVKIDPDSDPIEVGDFLTSSNKPGYAKKATESGYVIGKALEKWDHQEKIEVFINLIYANAEKRFENQQLQIDQLRQIVCLDHPENKLCL